MNIFVIDTHPRTAAQQLCDKHVVKMITESVQMLSNAMHSVGLEGPYNPTHWNHPCSVWVRESLENYQWLFQHANEMGFEYLRRYGAGGKKIHTAHKILGNMFYDIDLPRIGLTPFVNCTPYKDEKDVVQAYRKFYILDKSRFARWNKCTPPPDWYKVHNEVAMLQ